MGLGFNNTVMGTQGGDLHFLQFTLIEGASLCSCMRKTEQAQTWFVLMHAMAKLQCAGTV